MIFKRGISPLIATVVLISLVVVFAFGVYTWTTTMIKPLQESAEITKFVDVKVDAKFSEVSNCVVSEQYYCYSLMISNGENFKLGYLINTITSKGQELEDYKEYVLEPYESKIFEIYFDKSLGIEDIRSELDAILLN